MFMIPRFIVILSLFLLGACGSGVGFNVPGETGVAGGLPESPVTGTISSDPASTSAVVSSENFTVFTSSSTGLIPGVVSGDLFSISDPILKIGAASVAGEDS